MTLSLPSVTIPTNPATVAVAQINATVSAASGGGGGGSTPPAAGCPAVGTYTDLVDYPKTSGPATTIRLASGTIAVFPMPNVNPGHNSGQMWITDNVVSANGSFGLDVMISKCKGYIPTTDADKATAGSCYYHSNIASYNEVDWFGGVNTNNYPLSAMGFCPAIQGSGQYYFNFKYTYQTCNYGTCGQVFTWYDGWLN
jgi:hypothetical protein